MRIKDFFFMLLGGTVALCSCVKEDLSDCLPQEGSGVILRYDYLMNMKYANLFEDGVADLKVFIFNHENILCDTLNPAVVPEELVNTWTRRVELAPGSYTIVTWADGKETDQMFKFTDKNNATNGKTGGGIIGRTKLDDLKAILSTKADPDNQAVVIPQSNTLSSLFHGIQKDIVVNSGEFTTVATSLIKNTKTVRVKIGDLLLIKNGIIAASDFDVNIVGRNGQYDFDNKTTIEALPVKYTPNFSVAEDDTLRTDIMTLRVLKFRQEDPYTSPLLSITYRPDKLEICKNLNINELILKGKIPARDKDGQIIKDSEGAPVMVSPTSEYLNRQDLFEITFGITGSGGGLKFTVYVNGWEVENITPLPR